LSPSPTGKARRCRLFCWPPDATYQVQPVLGRKNESLRHQVAETHGRIQCVSRTADTARDPFRLPGMPIRTKPIPLWSKIRRTCSSPAILSRSASSMTSKAVRSGEAHPRCTVNFRNGHHKNVGRTTPRGAQIEEAIMTFERVALGRAKRRGRPPAWMTATRDGVGRLGVKTSQRVRLPRVALKQQAGVASLIDPEDFRSSPLKSLPGRG
jgi:hypothetical protein